MPKMLALHLGGALLVSLLLPGIASAHEQRDVGQYHFAVGFVNEPSIPHRPSAGAPSTSSIASPATA